METVSIWQKRLLNAHEVFSARKWVRFIRANRFEIDSSNEKLFYSFSQWFRSRTTSVPEIPLASSCLQFFQWIRNVDNLKIEMCLFRLENRTIALNESIGRTNCELYTRISGTLHWFTLTAHTKIGQYASSIICKLKMHSDQSSIVWKYHYIHIIFAFSSNWHLSSIQCEIWNYYSSCTHVFFLCPLDSQTCELPLVFIVCACFLFFVCHFHGLYIYFFE